ncbi:hypothetical protein LPJ64_004298 [Coemansia asiatica]|uniref:Thioredoxin domain-containing protein n=1 Tax=Coemansia asiatica TaxID=1052880 RepID=A0A9W7XIK1_9FUNG|nr:hypothetical protein LPJ64_004298 [Coemansia asiatica]
MKSSYFALIAILGTTLLGPAYAIADKKAAVYAASGSTATRYSDELEAETAAESKQLVPKSDLVIELDKQKYLELLKTHDEIFVEFYANWCAACHGLAPEFDKFARAASKKFPKVAISRADINKVEYLSSSYMVNMLPELVFLRRPNKGNTPEVRYVSANFTSEELLDYIGGGWSVDKPAGDYTTLWCTPTNFCGHVGGLVGEFVVALDQKFNRWDIPPWAFMAMVISVIYVLGQFAVGCLADRFRKRYRDSINKSDHETVKPVYFDEYRSDIHSSDKKKTDAPSTPAKSSTKSAKPGSATKRAKGKRSKKD